MRQPQYTWDGSTGQLVDQSGNVLPYDQWPDSWKQTWANDKQYLDDVSKKSLWDYIGIPVMAAGAFVGAGLAGGLGASGDAAASAAANPAFDAAGNFIGQSTVTGGGDMSFLDALTTLLGDASKANDVINTVSNLTGNGRPITTAGAVSQTAGSIEKSRADALAKAAEIQQAQDRLAQQGYLNDIAGKKYNLSVPSALGRTSAQGDILANAQDATVSGLPSYINVPTIGGGLRPSLFSANTRQLGGLMSRNALNQELSGSMLEKAPPSLTPLPTATGLDTALQGTAMGGSFLNALSGLANTGKSTITGFDPNEFTGPKTPTDEGVGIGETGATQGLDPGILEWLQQQQQGGG